TLTTATTSAAFRRLVRPRGRIARAALVGQRAAAAIVTRVDRGELRTAPAKQTPAGAATITALANRAAAGVLPGWLGGVLRKAPWLPWALLAFALLIALLALLFPVALAGAAALVGAGLYLAQRASALKQADAIREENQTPEQAGKLKNSPDFVIADPGS